MPLKAGELLVPNAAAWRSWLASEGTKKPMVWLVCARSGSSAPHPTYPDALDEALCYGWIDSGGGGRDAQTRYIRFGPRKTKSPWSRRNIGYIERLEAAGKMAAAGRAVVQQARENGMWDAAYSAGDAPGDLIRAVASSVAAQKAWDGMGKKDRYAIFVRLGSLPVGSLGRERKIAAVVERLVGGEGVDMGGGVDKAKSRRRALASRKGLVLNRRSITKGNGTRRSSARIATREVAEAS